MIAIVDYGVGNLKSIQNMLRAAGIDAVVSREPDVFRKASKLLLPGVGHFRFGMESLRSFGLVDVLNDLVLDARKPVLGICLGAQLLGRHSAEGDADGLNWIPMETVAFDRTRLSNGERVPHIGWTDTSHANCRLFDGLGDDARFYYVHSFHLRCDDPSMVICTATHGYSFAAGVAHGNVFGVQFHPEKSHVFGRRVLENFAAMDVCLGAHGAPASRGPQRAVCARWGGTERSGAKGSPRATEPGCGAEPHVR